MLIMNKNNKKYVYFYVGTVCQKGLWRFGFKKLYLPFVYLCSV